jgi:hypothetical protein
VWKKIFCKKEIACCELIRYESGHDRSGEDFIPTRYSLLSRLLKPMKNQPLLISDLLRLMVYLTLPIESHAQSNSS